MRRTAFSPPALLRLALARLALARLAAAALVAVMLAGLASAGAVSPARAGELVMFERKGCGWCRKFDADVAPVYERTEEGRRAPLRRVDLSQALPADITLASPVRFAPTFVLVDEGREIGRITGYASDEAFWGLLGALTEKLAPDRP
ncbi:thioredoxin fold domain-containing protein [Xanthobacter sp. AM11]|uniref:thioredoxin fold domain-containing protein n=1 Tax=Xanthobacter sp. AM11 TaxID=3380643 RepID=UPI0039BEF890